MRTSIVGPHAAAAVIHDDDVDGDRRPGGGASCPPPSGLSRPAERRSSLSMSPTAVDGGGTRTFGAWSYTWWRRKVRAGCIHSSGSDPIRCGRLGEVERRDIGGIRWQTMSGWGMRRRRRRCAARASCYDNKVLWYLITVLTYQSHVTTLCDIVLQSQPISLPRQSV